MAQPDTGKDGSFQRKDSAWRSWVRADSSSEFAAESGRYVLYASLGCPWASRCVAVRKLKGLEDAIELVICHSRMERTKPDDASDTHQGFVFKKDDQFPECQEDPYGRRFVRDIYEQAGDTLGKYTVPILWDKSKGTIVNNESSEIIRTFNTEFNALAKNPKLDLYPEALRSKIDEINDFVYPNLNNGVYRAGFAKEQKAYDAAENDVHTAMVKIEKILSESRYLVGNRFTEADVRLFVTLVRFDAAYSPHFKCVRSHIRGQFPNILDYIRDIYQKPGVAETVNLGIIRTGYYSAMPTVNPSGIVAAAPEFIFDQKHDRDRFGAAE